MAILGIIVLAAIGIVQWRKARAAELDAAFKAELLERGTSLADLEKLLAARGPGPKSWLEQFGALSGGAKTGLIIGVILVVNFVVGAVIAVNTSRNFPLAIPSPPAVLSPAGPILHPAVDREGPGAGQVFYLDLQPAANQLLSQVISGEEGNSLAGLPPGRQDMGGAPFQIGPGLIRLASKNHPDLPREVVGLRVGLKFDKLHLLQAAEFGDRHPYLEKEGVEIGRYQVHYADGSVQTIPLIYGEDVRDFWNWGTAGDLKRAKVAWTGGNPAAGRYGATLRLYQSTWENPRPDVEVTALDLRSAGSTASPLCVALTAERAWR